MLKMTHVVSSTLKVQSNGNPMERELLASKYLLKRSEAVYNPLVSLNTVAQSVFPFRKFSTAADIFFLPLTTLVDDRTSALTWMLLLVLQKNQKILI